MNVLTLNIQHGGGARHTEILRVVGAVSPDVVVFTEYRENATGARLVAGLTACGLLYHSASGPTPKTNAVLIASRCPIDRLELPFALSKANEHRVVLVRTQGLEMCGVYFAGKAEKARFWRDEFLPLAEQMLPRRCLLIGDFNTGKHLIDEAGRTFYGAQHFEAMETTGWTDAWRSLHPSTREFTWYSHAGNGFRVDHCWLSPSLASELLGAEHVHEARLQAVTDHSGLLVRLA